MSQAPTQSTADPSSSEYDAFRKAVARRAELLREGMSNSGHERNCCYLNTRNGRFANISAAAGLDHIGDGRAYALVDWDHDGDLDLWATNRTASRVQFLRNNSNHEYHFLAVKLEGNGTITNRDAIGARVELILKNDQPGKSIKTVHAGTGFLGQSSKTLHFGLGSQSEIDRLIVHWPGSETEEFTDIEADRHYKIVQGSKKAHPWSRPVHPVQLVASSDEIPEPSEQTRISLRYRIPMPTLTFETFEGTQRNVDTQRGTPTLVNLWASWCQPCLKELAEFRRHETQLRDLGLDVLALSVDKLAADLASNPEAARAFLKRQKFPFEAGFASNDLIGKLEAAIYYLFDFNRPWAVPTSFLLDERGRLAVIYVGTVDVDRLIADVEQLSLSDEAWLEASLPFEGRWAGAKRHPNLTALIQTYIDRDFVEAGLQFVDEYADALVADPNSSALLVRLANSLRDEGDVVKSKRRFEQAIEADLHNGAAHFLLGKLLAQSREFDDATRHCREAVRLRPNDAEAHFFLANLLESQGDKEGALVHFLHVVEQQPGSSKARLALGKAYVGKQQWEKAGEQLRQAAQLEPENASIHYQLAIVLLRQGQTHEAISQFRHALEIEPDSLKLMNGLAWTIATAEQSTTEEKVESVQLAKRAAEKTKYAHPQILDTLAASYASAGQFKKAIQTAEKAIARAHALKKKELANEIRGRLKRYRLGKPYRDPGG